MSTEPPIRIQCVVIDCAEPHELARFWAAALGWRVTFSSDAECALEPPEGSPETDVSPDLVFLRVPDEKVVKNRLHLDLRPDAQDAQVEDEAEVFDAVIYSITAGSWRGLRTKKA